MSPVLAPSGLPLRASSVILCNPVILKAMDLGGMEPHHLQASSSARFWVGTHDLRVVTSRWERSCGIIARAARVCERCTDNVVEDEYHMVFECLLYDSLRTQVFKYSAYLMIIQQVMVQCKSAPVDVIGREDSCNKMLAQLLLLCMSASWSAVSWVGAR